MLPAVMIYFYHHFIFDIKVEIGKKTGKPGEEKDDSCSPRVSL